MVVDIVLVRKDRAIIKDIHTIRRSNLLDYYFLIIFHSSRYGIIIDGDA